MSAIGKASIGFKKLDTTADKALNQSFKVLFFAHKFTTAGLTDIDLTGLTTPPEMTGFVNPTSFDLLNANLKINPNTLRLQSSINGPLAPFASYDIISNNIIRLKDGAISQVGEIIYGWITPVNMTGLLAVPGVIIVQTGTVSVGTTDIVVNTPFIYNNYPTQQLGDVALWLDGEIQMRNVGNISSGDGNYYEIAPSTGNLSNTLRLNVAPVGTAKNYVIYSTGVSAIAPDSQVLAAIQTMATQMNAVIQDLAVVTGNPTSNYQTAPNYVDLSVFGNLVKSFISGVHYDAVVGSAAQYAAGQCTHTSVQAAINYVGALSTSGKVFVLQGTYTENITLSSKVTIEGKGNMSYINGTLTVQSGASYSWIKGLRWGNNITINASANSIFLRECWQVTGKSITDNGTGNSILVAQE